MSGVISAVKAVAYIIDAISNGDSSDPKEIAKTVLGAATSNKLSLIRTDGSITRLLSNYIVEPVIIASNSTREYDVIEKILEANLDMFSSFYLQAFEILRNVYGLDTGIVVNSLGTDNSTFIKDTSVWAGKQSLESIKLPLDELLSFESLSLSIEDDNDKGYKAKSANTSTTKDFKEQATSTLLQRNIEVTMDVSGTIISKNEERNGKTFKHTVIIPITIKAHVLFVTIDNILTMLKPNANDKTFAYRFDEYRAGIIGLADLIFCNDIIKKYKENKLDDKAKLLDILNDRTLSANSKVTYNGMAGFEKYYNMLVVTDEDKVKLDKHVNGNIVDPKYKEKLLEQAKAMTCTVIDSAYERIYILVKDIRGKTDISFKSISKRKESGADLSEIVRALMTNRTPVF